MDYKGRNVISLILISISSLDLSLKLRLLKHQLCDTEQAKDNVHFHVSTKAASLRLSIFTDVHENLLILHNHAANRICSLN